MLLVSFSVISFGLWINLFAHSAFFASSGTGGRYWSNCGWYLVWNTELRDDDFDRGRRSCNLRLGFGQATSGPAWAARVARTQLPKEILELNG